MSRLPMGIYDDLDNQTQPVFYIDPVSTNILIFGDHATGKTSFLKTLLIRMHECIDPSRQTDIHIADFGGNLGMYEDLCQVSACFSSANEENIRRIFKALDKKISNNAVILRSRRFLDVFNSDAEEKPVHLVLVVDNVNAFLADERYEIYHEELLAYCRDGLAKGLTVIFTATDISGGLGRFMGSFGSKFAFSISQDKYVEIFGSKVFEHMSNPGRGVSVIGGKLREFQAFLPFAEEETQLKEFIEMTGQIPVKTEKMRVFDRNLTLDNYDKYVSSAYVEGENEDNISVGLDYYEHMPININLNTVRSVAIYGKKGFGKTNLLRVMINAIRTKHPDYSFVFFDDGREQLKEFYDESRPDDKYFIEMQDMVDFVTENGYYRTSKEKAKVVTRPPTVFVLQNKNMFNTKGEILMKQKIPEIIGSAEDSRCWVILAHMKKFFGAFARETEIAVNNSLFGVFLLDNIAEFAAERGTGSVFGEMDVKELKAQYARCELGDGYLYNVESDDLQKLKFIKLDKDKDKDGSKRN